MNPKKKVDQIIEGFDSKDELRYEFALSYDLEYSKYFVETVKIPYLVAKALTMKNLNKNLKYYITTYQAKDYGS